MPDSERHWLSRGPFHIAWRLKTAAKCAKFAFTNYLVPETCFRAGFVSVARDLQSQGAFA